MAERRMFAKTIIDSDAFIDMPVTARLLYYDLGMRADDDGFINAPKKIMRMIGASEDDMRILIARKFIIPFETGVVVIKHWRINNYLRSDRYKETTYQEEKQALTVKENGAYSLDGIPMVDQPVYQRYTQDSIGKDSIDKNSIEKGTRFRPPTLEEVQEYCQTRGNKVNAEQFLDYYQARGWRLKTGTMKDWKASIRTWERNGYDDKPAKKETKFNSFEQRDYNYSDLERKLLGG